MSIEVAVSVLFIISSIFLPIKVLIILFSKPKTLNVKDNKHSRQFFISNAGASLRTSMAISITWMVITNKLYQDDSSWSTFLDTQNAIEFIASISLILCVSGIMGVISGRRESVSEGEDWNGLSPKNFLVTLYCLVPVFAYYFGLAYHSVVFYFH